MMSFKDFVHKYNSKIKATRNVKFQQVLSFVALSDVKIYLGDGSFLSDVGIVILDQSKGIQ